MQENFFIKFYWICRGFAIEHDSLSAKNQNISPYQTTNLLKTWFSLLVCKKEQKEDKKEFITKSVEIIVYN